MITDRSHESDAAFQAELARIEAAEVAPESWTGEGETAAEIARQCWWAGATGVPVGHAEQHVAATLAAAEQRGRDEMAREIAAAIAAFDTGELWSSQVVARLRALVDVIAGTAGEEGT